MARRHVVEEPEHTDRWLVSYADFITLLMAFFVVMYSISAVNVGKYRVLSSTLSEAFHAPARSMDPIQVGELSRQEQVPGSSIIDLLAGGPPRPGLPSEQQDKDLAEIQGAMDELFQELTSDDLVEITGNELWVEVEMKSGLLFDSGSAYPSLDAEIILQEVANILRGKPNPIHVEGFTDNVPIRTEAYPSNWELSAARSAAVIRLLEENGVSPDRLAAVGFGEHQPVASNETEAGRKKNRRVVMVISRNMNIRRAVSAIGSDRAVENVEQIRALDQTIRAREAVEPAAQPVRPVPPAKAPAVAVPEPSPESVQPEAELPAEAQTPAPTTAKPTVRAVRTEGGGLLFTRKPPESTDEEENAEQAPEPTGGEGAP